MKKITVIIIALAVLIIKPARADEQPRILKGIEFLSGFGRGRLVQKQDYQLVPLIIAFDFDIKPLTKRIGFNPASLVCFLIEPYVSLVAAPETDIEAGTSFLFKVGLVPEGSLFQPYIKSGVGVSYISLHTHEQSTQCNFISHLGAGFHYFLNEKLALTFEYRFRHLSNASIKQPNSGIDTHYALMGISRLF